MAKAIDFLQKATELDADNPGFYQDLGTAYRLNEDIDAALRSYETASALKSKNALLYLNLGDIY